MTDKNAQMQSYYTTNVGEMGKIPLNPPFSKGEKEPLPFVKGD
jgi:hypothetical protein